MKWKHFQIEIYWKMAIDGNTLLICLCHIHVCASSTSSFWGPDFIKLLKWKSRMSGGRWFVDFVYVFTSPPHVDADVSKCNIRMTWCDLFFASLTLWSINTSLSSSHFFCYALQFHTNVYFPLGVFMYVWILLSMRFAGYMNEIKIHSEKQNGKRRISFCEKHFNFQFIFLHIFCQIFARSHHN